MLVKETKYTDFNGDERTEKLYFNLSSAEVIALQFGNIGGLDKALERLTNTEDVGEIFKIVDKFIVSAYGEKSDDGRYFNKSEEISTKFKQSAAYSNLLIELLNETGKFEEFVNGVIPKEVNEAIKKENNE